MERNEGGQNGQLPVISAKTVETIKRDLKLDTAETEQKFLKNIISEREGSTDQKLEQLTSNMAYDLIHVNPKFVEALQKGIQEGEFYAESKLVRTSIIQGMVTVLRIFDTESEFKLLLNLDKIKDDASLEKIKNLVYENLGKKREMDPFEAAMKTPRIPETQINLNELLQDLSANLYFKSTFNRGASVMYNILSEFKSELFVPSQTPPPAEPFPGSAS